MKKAEETLKKERVLRVLKKASAGGRCSSSGVGVMGADKEANGHLCSPVRCFPLGSLLGPSWQWYFFLGTF